MESDSILEVYFDVLHNCIKSSMLKYLSSYCTESQNYFSPSIKVLTEHVVYFRIRVVTDDILVTVLCSLF
jgi:hypothetical protein